MSPLLETGNKLNVTNIDRSPTFKLVKQARDDRFSIDELEHYSLTLQVGIKDFQVAVTDSQNNRCMALEDYELLGIRTVNARLRLLKKILDNHEYLTAGFWKDVKLCLKTHKFSLVPSEIFIPESAGDYLAVNSEIKLSFEEVGYYKQISADFVSVFAVELKLSKWLGSIYKKRLVHIVHQGSVLIEGVLKNDNHSHEKSLFCFIDRGILHVICAAEGKLLYYNQFASRSKEDILKYIMLVFNELGMNPKINNVSLWGYVKQNSDEIELLKKYIRNVSFGARPSFLKYSYQFDEVEDHQYFGVLSAYLCM